MSRLHVHTERHATSRIGWLRAAVMGANELAVTRVDSAIWTPVAGSRARLGNERLAQHAE